MDDVIYEGHGAWLTLLVTRQKLRADDVSWTLNREAELWRKVRSTPSHVAQNIVGDHTTSRIRIQYLLLVILKPLE